MYTPVHFKNEDFAELCALIRFNPLGVLVVASDAGFEINHIPFVLDTENESVVRLRAHMPKFNPLIDLVSESKSCVIVFQGADGYVSPSWYQTKKEHGKVVPTWNYNVVHVHGKLNLRTDATWLSDQLNDLTNQSEQNRANAWSVSDAPKEFTEKQMSSLVGLEIEIERFIGKTKASQNQPKRNQISVLEALETEQLNSSFHQMVSRALDRS